MTRGQVIKRGTAISVGLALMLLSAAVSAAWWVRGDRELFWSGLTTMREQYGTRLERVEADVRELRKSIDGKLDAILAEVRR